MQLGLLLNLPDVLAQIEVRLSKEYGFLAFLPHDLQGGLFLLVILRLTDSILAALSLTVEYRHLVK